jgi:hypothetical protein
VDLTSQAIILLLAVIFTCATLTYPYICRRVWSKEEDDSIRNLVAAHGTRSWSVIAEKIASDKST